MAVTKKIETRTKTRSLIFIQRNGVTLASSVRGKTAPPTTGYAALPASQLQPAPLPVPIPPPGPIPKTPEPTSRKSTSSPKKQSNLPARSHHSGELNRCLRNENLCRHGRRRASQSPPLSLASE